VSRREAGRLRGTDPQPQPTRIRRVRVEKLFSEFDHDIELALDERVTLITGPNGAGKTTMMRLINALYHRDYRTLGAMRFLSMDLIMASEHRIRIERLDENGQSSAENRPMAALRFSLSTQPGRPDATDIVEIPTQTQDAERVAAWVARFAPEWERIAPTEWRNLDNFETLNLYPLVRRLELWHAIADPTTEHVVSWLDDYLPPGRCRFLTNDRLWSDHLPRFQSDARSLKSGLSVDEWSNRLKRVISMARETYSRVAQETDAGFASRLLDRLKSGDRIQYAPALFQIWQGIAKRGGELLEAGLVDARLEDLLGDYSEFLGDPIVLTVLDEYIGATLEKFQSVEAVEASLNNLRDQINLRYNPQWLTRKLDSPSKEIKPDPTFEAPQSVMAKRIRLDRDRGIQIEKEDGTVLAPSDLSSGEQQQLITVCELLFGLESGTLLLIDEPETSLHITWQTVYVELLLEITALRAADAIVATHSPDIIGRWDALERPLFPNER
jgi:ABC-type lipoprotein export system ATPase subunit